MVLLSLALFLFGAVLSFVLKSSPKACSMIAATSAVAAASVGLVPCIMVLAGHPAKQFVAPWQMPYGSFSLQLDTLSAFFLLPIFVLSALTAIYGVPYLLHLTEKNKELGAAWFCFNLLCASMAVVVLAANVVLFLIAWELTVFSSFFLVAFEYQHKENRKAAWIYLIASHFGTACIIVLFLLLARESGSFEFAAFSHAADLEPALKGALFLLAIFGFGTKAGFIPLHVWLPEAHPAAPSHVSSLMSGVMIKTGIYGIVRLLFMLGHPPLWWGWTLVAIGLSSGILGVLFALAQHDLKRLLAYHSVENIGIIALGLGLGLLGLSSGNHVVAVLGFVGGLLHVINHAVFKGLLFLGAGAVLQETGTREIDSLGGLLKRMPWTGTTFLVGCMSISGLPPFNGFVSEFIIYLGVLLAVTSGIDALMAPSLLILVGLALIGGLAAACFVKAFSVVFLGSPRSSAGADAKEVGLAMRIPLVVLAGLCALIPLGAPFILGVFVRVLAGHPDLAVTEQVTSMMPKIAAPLTFTCVASFCLLLLLIGILTVRNILLSRRKVGAVITWDCGYAKPTTTMQYTGSSFAQPLTDLFHTFLRTQWHLSGVQGYFPTKAAFHSNTLDVFQEIIFRPLFGAVGALSRKLRWMQLGVVQVYVLYLALTLTVVLIWELW